MTMWKITSKQIGIPHLFKAAVYRKVLFPFHLAGIGCFIGTIIS